MLDFNRFELLTFDCYGTLINWEDGILGCLRAVLAAHGKTADDTTILQLYGDLEATAEHGEYRPYRDVLRAVVQAFGGHFDFAPTNHEAESLAASLRNWQPWPDTVSALRELRKHYRLAIISNVDDDLFAATRPKLEVDFDHVITAQQARAYKPSLKIFELALGRIAVPTHRIMHVAQSLYHDAVPAQSLGIATAWVNRPSKRSGVGAVKSAQAQPDFQVSSLQDLANICCQK
jgi:2-haloacid dehalogenase